MNNQNIYVTMPTLAPLSEVNDLLKNVWDSGIMTHNGPLVQKFEKDVCAFLGVENMVSVVNGTIALHLAIKSLDLKGEIITTPFTFIATASSIVWEGCTPVFVDIDPETFNIDPAKIEEKISEKTVAILPVHVFGNPCNIEEIDLIAKKHNLKVIYDAAHAVGVKYNGKSIFEYGDISTTSFHATKMLNTAEGGACFTTDKDLFERLQSMRFFGFNKQKDNVTDEGTNAKITEIHAAIGLANLKYLQQALDDRCRKYALYKKRLSENSNLRFQKINQHCNYSYFPVVFNTEEELLFVEKELIHERFFPRRYFFPVLNAFDTMKTDKCLPNAESIAKRILCLPLYFDLADESIVRICDIILSSISSK